MAGPSSAGNAALLPPLHPSSTLVNVAEHAEVHLVHLLAERAPAGLLTPSFTSDCETCIANADATGLLRTVLRDNGAMSALFSGMGSVDESVSAFSLLASLLDRIQDPAQQSTLALEMADAVGRDDRFEVQTRIAMLAALYNLRSDGTEKCRMLALLVRLCSSANSSSASGGAAGATSSSAGGAGVRHMLSEGQPLGDMIAAERIVKLLDQWNVAVEERRLLYRSIVEGFGRIIGDGSAAGTDEGKEDQKRRQRFLLLYVSSYKSKADLDADALYAAKQAAVGAIRDPISLFAQQRSLLSMPAIVALGEAAQTQALHNLLQIFSEGKLEDFKSYASTPQGHRTLEEHHLSYDACVRHMRLLSLCSLAAEHEEIPYQAIAETLQLDGELVMEEVEGWVVAGVSSGLWSARMDQLQRVVMVERCVVRKFGMGQWLALQAKLNGWKKNVRGVLEGLKQHQQQHGGGSPEVWEGGAPL